MEQLQTNFKTENVQENCNNNLLIKQIDKAKNRLGGNVSPSILNSHVFETFGKMNMLIYVEDCVKMTSLELSEIQELKESGLFPAMYTSDSDENPLWLLRDIVRWLNSYYI